MSPFRFGAFLLISLVVFSLIGYGLDLLFHTSPFWLIAGILYAVIGTFIIFVYKNRSKK